MNKTKVYDYFIYQWEWSWKVYTTLVLNSELLLKSYIEFKIYIYIVNSYK